MGKLLKDYADNKGANQPVNPCSLISTFVLHCLDSATSRENQPSGFPTRLDTNWAVQTQKMAEGLEFCTKELDGLYYVCSDNKGADQLRGLPHSRSAPFEFTYRGLGAIRL